MVNRVRFRRCLYRLLILRNILESKVYKENLVMMYAYEQLIMNAE
jgi:hypothetical protein